MLPGQELFDEDTPCHCCGFKEGDEGAPQGDGLCSCYDEELSRIWEDLLELGAEVTVKMERGYGPYDID